jgi:hypothetical protein
MSAYPRPSQRMDKLVGILYPNLVAKISEGSGCCQEGSRSALDAQDVISRTCSPVMYTLPILYDIYCLMLLKRVFEAFRSLEFAPQPP